MSIKHSHRNNPVVFDAKIPFDGFLDELVLNIFGFLNRKDLSVAELVNKKWKTLSHDVSLFTQRFEGTVFLAAKWNVLGFPTSEFPFERESISQILDASCSFTNSRIIRTTQTFLLMPMNLTLNWIIKKFQINDSGFALPKIIVNQEIIKKFGEEKVSKSFHAFIMNSCLDVSGENKEVELWVNPHYKKPNYLVVVVQKIFRFMMAPSKPQFDKKHTICQEDIWGLPLHVAHLPDGIHIETIFDESHSGIAPMRILSDSEK